MLLYALLDKAGYFYVWCLQNMLIQVIPPTNTSCKMLAVYPCDIMYAIKALCSKSIDMKITFNMKQPDDDSNMMSRSFNTANTIITS